MSWSAAASAVASASAVPSQPACAANLYNIPVTAPACAIPYGGNHTDIMSACCAQVVSYYNDCGLFCLAQGQTVGDLTNCLYSQGAAYQDVFCNDKTTAMATGGPVNVAASASASILTGGVTGATPTAGFTGSMTSPSGSPDSGSGISARCSYTVGISVVVGLLVGLQMPMWLL